MSNPSKKQSIDASVVLKSYNEYLEDPSKGFLNIKFTNARSNTDKTVFYYETTIRVDDKWLPCLVKLPFCKANKCKPPEERAKLGSSSNSNAKIPPPTFSIHKSTVSTPETGSQPIGEALYVINEEYYKILDAKVSGGKKPQMIYQFVQHSFGSDATEIQDPLIRIRVKPRKTDTNNLPQVKMIVNGKPTNCLTSGAPITTDNVHTILRSGAMVMGVINLSTTMLSKQGYSNDINADMLIVKPPAEERISMDDEFTVDELKLFNINPDDANKSSNILVAQEQPEMEGPDAPGVALNADPDYVEYEEHQQLEADVLDSFA